MTPEQAAAMSEQMLQEHQAAMKGITEKSKENAETWAGVTSRLAERFTSTGASVQKILDEMAEPKEEAKP